MGFAPSVRSTPYAAGWFAMRKRRSWSTSGKEGCTIFAAMKLAKTSFIQTSSNQFMVTRSPNHMWLVSWAMTEALPRIWFCVGASSSMRDDCW